MSMEKNAVRGKNSSTKNVKYASAGCPVCGSALDFEGTLPRCPVHGTSPFEYGAFIDRKANKGRGY